MVTIIKDIKTEVSPPQLTLYQYDQLNRIKEMKAYTKINMETNAWGSGTDRDGAHQTSMEYDANGNITKMKRNGMSGNLVMDDMEYLYENVLSGSVKNTNKLIQVLDKASKSAYGTDIDGQDAKNYTYDEIGNLKKDDAEKISNIEWSVYGKPLKITKNIGGYGPTTEIEFRYDAIGNRVAKIVKPMYNIDNPEAWNHTFYVRDASGNVMATYQRTGYEKLMLEEQSIYGSSRLGVQRRNLDYMAATTNPSYKYYLNQKYYELSDHRGNVNTTISDFRIGVGSVANPRVLSHYTAIIRSTADYGVWGDELVGRGERSKDFRYGFNGKEKVNEVKGDGNIYDYGFRFYDPRIGKFLSVDPLTKGYPWYTPYQFAGNKPIAAIDLDGLEEVFRINYRDVNGAITKTTVILARSNDIKVEATKIWSQMNNGIPVDGKRFNSNNSFFVEGFDAYRKGSYTKGGQNIAPLRGELTIDVQDGFNNFTYSKSITEDEAYSKASNDYNAGTAYDIADGLDKLGQGITTGGIAVSAVNPLVGRGLMTTGDVVSMASDVTEIVTDVTQEKYGTAILKAGLMVPDAIGGKLLEKTELSDTQTQIISSVIGLGFNAIQNKMGDVKQSAKQIKQENANELRNIK